MSTLHESNRRLSPVQEALLSEHNMPSPYTDTGRYLRRGIWLVALGFGGAILWAGLAPLDKGVAVTGKVIVTDNRKVVQPVNSGRISRLNIREGDIVQQGQILATLDTPPTQTLYDNLYIQLLEARYRAARLRAERDKLSRLVAPEPMNFISPLASSPLALTEQHIQLSQQQLLFSRQSALQQEISAMQASIIGMQAQKQGLRALLDNYQIQYRLIDEQLKGLRPLAGEGYIARNRLLEIERQAAQLRGDIAQQNGNVVQISQNIAELEKKILQRQEEYQKEVRTQLAEVQINIEDLTQRLKAADYDLKNTQILAPASGSVVGLTVHTEGSVVSGGQTLMEIVPVDQPLQIDARLPIELVDKITSGLPVELMFSAFNQSTTPRIAGVVVLVGADQLIDAQTGTAYYPLRINVDETEKQQIANLDIRPGMPVEAFIRTGERSMLNYLFKPLLDRLHTALTEE
ncbi:hemolysin D [Brenneria alni]|uniref:Membrane fusion protein (MFP) family protein n=1 Tax=Brenneria alni TaxID=71656 RepID=A0A421DJP7_9GAMM|nr:HlyD family type I secretion periplasmic adaptor subunit [Brenneria alni]RLM19009.1 hemolysin D [Brenneria alni]